MSELLNFIKNPEVWTNGIVPDEFRNIEDWKEELNTGSNAPEIQ